ncbi:MAG: PHP domain-containing protein [Thermodesulfobacteriota bacterium]
MSEIDLHTHSSASDGTLSPAELVQEALSSGLKALALTDHDTTNGLQEARQAAQEQGLELIPGCELSVEFRQGQLHILGLWLPWEPRQLKSTLQNLRDKRHSRNERILAKLQNLGLDLEYGQVKELAGEASIGRPHIARVLLENGYVTSIQEAFDRYIGPQGAAYVPKDKLGPAEAIQVLRQEQATVILAHPYTLELPLPDLAREIQGFKELGLQGLEVYYPDHTQEQIRDYLQLAQDMDLLISGGTDFHGSVKPNIRLGVGRGDLELPYSLLQEIKQKRKAQGLWVI